MARGHRQRHEVGALQSSQERRVADRNRLGRIDEIQSRAKGLPKEDWVDGACVGKGTPEKIETAKVKPLCVKALGHNSRQMCRESAGLRRAVGKCGRLDF